MGRPVQESWAHSGFGVIRGYNAVMQRAVSFTLLAASVLLAAALQAQPAGGAMRGGGGRAATGSEIGGRSGSRSGGAGNARSRGRRNYALLYPLWYDEPLDYEEPGPPDEFAPPLRMAQGNPRPAAPRYPTAPKITELPGAAEAAASKPLPPALFILTNGERIEAQQYLVTYEHVQLTVDRQPRTIPLAMLDVNATLAAERARGIDLRIPAGRSEISLGF